MTPTADKARFAKTGTVYTVELAGDVAMDATTTVLSMLLMHPSLSHPSAEVSAAQMRGMAARLGAIIAAKGGNVTSEDLYNLIHNVLKTAVDNVVSVASKGTQENGAKRLLGWLVGGGKKALKMVVGLPGKIAKGGALGNRAFRMTNPESVMEYFIVAVGFQPGDCLPFIKAMSIFYGMPGEDCVLCANMKCGAQCDTCGNACVGTGKNLHSLMLDACLICNEKGTASSACSTAYGKSLMSGAYTPGAGQTEEKTVDLRRCVVNACEACNTWYLAQQVCKFPD